MLGVLIRWRGPIIHPSNWTFEMNVFVGYMYLLCIYSLWEMKETFCFRVRGKFDKVWIVSHLLSVDSVKLFICFVWQNILYIIKSGVRSNVQRVIMVMIYTRHISLQDNTYLKYLFDLSFPLLQH